MSKKEIMQAVVVGEYVSFILASILVIVFQFIGLSLFITVSLALYVAAFGLCGIENLVEAVSLFRAKQTDISAEMPNLMVEGEDGKPVKISSKKDGLKLRKFKAILMATISIAVAIFTLIVLVLF